MLGDPRPADAFANELFDRAPWTAPEIRAHEGYARDHFHALIDRPSPPPEIAGNVWRACERLTWNMVRCARLLEAQRDRLIAA